MVMSGRWQSGWFGGLKCRICDDLPAASQPRVLVVLCHGFGAPGDDLVELATALLAADSKIAATCRFAFPEAPLDLTAHGMPGGRAWWPINMARLAAMQATEDYSELTRLEPPGMVDAARQLALCITELRCACLPVGGKIAIGGFSQGAMVTCHAVLSQQVDVDLLVQFSGTLLWIDEWRKMMEGHPGTRVLQSHGDDDQVLPPFAAVELQQMLLTHGFDVEFISFRGGHTIPYPAVDRLAKRLAAMGTASRKHEA
jgi:phospholipase/carboxylesterase